MGHITTVLYSCSTVVLSDMDEVQPQSVNDVTPLPTALSDAYSVDHDHQTRISIFDLKYV